MKRERKRPRNRKKPVRRRMNADIAKRARRALEKYEKLVRQLQAQAEKSEQFLRPEADE